MHSQPKICQASSQCYILFWSASVSQAMGVCLLCGVTNLSVNFEEELDKESNKIKGN